MQRLIAKYTLIVILSVFAFTGIAAGAASVSNLTLRLNTNQRKEATLHGKVLTREAEVPLAFGTVTINGEKVKFQNGEFVVDNLTPGDHSIVIEGAYRKPFTRVITVKPGDNSDTFLVDSSVNQSEIDMLARITRAEAEGESNTGQVAVAATVLNRVNSARYPSSVREVVYQRISGRYQYSPVRDGRIRLAPRPADYRAAYQALAGQDPSHGATGFFNPAKTRDRWVHSQQVTTVIGQHKFFTY